MNQALLKITGKVQGVFYRDSSQEKAQQLGLSGYAKNMQDGSVEALVQGEEGAIKAFVDWAAQGPPSAEVKNVEVKWQSPTGAITGFDVL